MPQDAPQEQTPPAHSESMPRPMSGPDFPATIR
eukprot:CAMPEP_0183307580 /NCGR_PEP_ID=MMETSP0160_2-20130417/18115_1 /TAXON_ID=2839 ORGANISM="Odontella Sinensis, Strain Grunow 1884" /NCGR_SAMPLE_ID=MMETSP0160_2 /ASSEMBLY_ACC=CAM_ASM_000250 /LENGTH=32 /DNA_ID= /DNA_START= /DNA_END= /DNA_ORIENTATION=